MKGDCQSHLLQRDLGYNSEYWGQGLASRALSDFLAHVNMTCPIHARMAADNRASLRVPEKCGFRVTGQDRGFANARGAEIAELILELGGIPEAV